MEKESSCVFDYATGFFSCFSPLTMFHVYFSPFSTAYNFPLSKPHYHLIVIQRQAETAMKICWCVRGRSCFSYSRVSCWQASHSQAMFLWNLEDMRKKNVWTWLLLEGSCESLALKKVCSLSFTFFSFVLKFRVFLFCSQLLNCRAEMNLIKVGDKWKYIGEEFKGKIRQINT